MRGVVDEGVGCTTGVGYGCGEADGEKRESVGMVEVSLWDRVEVLNRCIVLMFGNRHRHG